MYKTFIKSILEDDLTVDQSYSIAQYILSGDANDIEIASLLTALKFKDESYEVIAGFAQALKLYSTDMLENSDQLIDVCGTGGDGSNTFNISTTVSLLIASKTKVSKHGNRSISSKSGSADVLKELGIPMPKSATEVKDIMDKTNYCFLFAPHMHPNMSYVMPVRTTLGIPTIFNIVGPLCNPYQLDYQVIGVYKESLLMPMAKALLHLGIKRAAIVYGHGGLDELSISGINQVIYIIDGQIAEDVIDPLDYKISYQSISELKGGSALLNANITKDVLSGLPGAKQDVVALNAGLAFFISKVTASIEIGVTLAYQLLKEQAGLHIIEKLKRSIS